MLHLAASDIINPNLDFFLQAFSSLVSFVSLIAMSFVGPVDLYFVLDPLALPQEISPRTVNTIVIKSEV